MGVPQLGVPGSRTSSLAPREKTGLFRGAFDWYKRTDANLEQKTADILGTTPEKVHDVALGAAIVSGVGFLASGVKNLFDGTAKANRLERKEARQAKRAEKKGISLTQQFDQTFGQGVPVSGGVSTPTPAFSMDKAGMMLKQYWWVVLILFVLFTPMGKKLIGGNPRRRPARRKPKTVIRYRTRKAPVKRRAR